MKIQFRQIGTIHSPYKTKEEAPIQAWKSKEKGKIEVFKKYATGLKDIEGFSHIIILYLFHKSKGFSLLVKPFLDKHKRGLFATRYPARPNQIGLTIVKLLKRKGNVLIVEGMDVIDGTPLLDIKPHIPIFDYRKNVKIGWLTNKIK